jgi:hypothetical protein
MTDMCSPTTCLLRATTPGGSGGDFGPCVPILLLRLGAQDLGLGERPETRRRGDAGSGAFGCALVRGVVVTGTMGLATP